MKSDENKPKQPRDHTEEGKNSADSAVGTEAALKGGSEPAKRQAERDWQESSKESGD